MKNTLPFPLAAHFALHPVTDAFGTRLEPQELLDGLSEAGLKGARLVLLDDEVVLECPHPDLRIEAVSRALVALVVRFSPLLRVRPAPLGAVALNSGGHPIVDLRKRKVEIVAFMEASKPEEALEPGLADLCRRLGIAVENFMPGDGGSRAEQTLRPDESKRSEQLEDSGNSARSEQVEANSSTSVGSSNFSDSSGSSDPSSSSESSISSESSGSSDSSSSSGASISSDSRSSSGSSISSNSSGASGSSSSSNLQSSSESSNPSGSSISSEPLSSSGSTDFSDSAALSDSSRSENESGKSGRLHQEGKGGSEIRSFDVLIPPISDSLRAGLMKQVAGSIQSLGLPETISCVTLSTLVPGRSALEIVGSAARAVSAADEESRRRVEFRAPDALHFLVWFRPGGEKGVRPAAMVAGSTSIQALQRVGRALAGAEPSFGAESEGRALPDILLDGLSWRVGRRPTVAALADSASSSPIALDAERCTECGICTAMCPTGFLGDGIRPVFPESVSTHPGSDSDFESRSALAEAHDSTFDADFSAPLTDSGKIRHSALETAELFRDAVPRKAKSANLSVTGCTRCYECVEACPTDALRPVSGKDTATLASFLRHRPGWLSALAGLPGPSFPGAFPPSYFLWPNAAKPKISEAEDSSSAGPAALSSSPNSSSDAPSTPRESVAESGLSERQEGLKMEKLGTGHLETEHLEAEHLKTEDLEENLETEHRKTEHRKTGHLDSGHRKTGLLATEHFQKGSFETEHRRSADLNKAEPKVGHLWTGTREVFEKPRERGTEKLGEFGASPQVALASAPEEAAWIASESAEELKNGAPARYVLGLSVITMQEHAAALLKNGEVVGAIEHEKLVRVRHAGWHPPGRPGVTAGMDPTLTLEEILCRRPIRALLEAEGITLDDIELFAINGLHGKHVDHIPFLDARRPIPTLRSGRVLHVPHHLSHAASAYRASGFEQAWILTVDGRGDRECLALWRGSKGRIEPVDTLLSFVDQSIGGVYEGVTRILGFGSHGQGSVMALAAFGEPTFDFKGILSADSEGRLQVHESAVNERFGHLQRQPGEELTQEHKNLAASLQHALEQSIVAFLEPHLGKGPIDALCLAGGVALNCRFNEKLRHTFQPRHIFAQAGANDGGTAVGAALEAWAELGGKPPAPMDHAYLGPEFENAEIETVLRRSGLRYRRMDSVAEEVAQLLCDGKVVCWFQGRMEFGPRALGARSIIADPRNPQIHSKVNRLKNRESWRPFGPSILAGHESQWLERAFDSRFMLFTLPVKAERRDEIPAVVHVDGSTRPQVVHAEHSPRYHAMISAFHKLSGVPMVVNTSFNRRGEPIVCTPSDAVDSFLGLGADFLAIGDFLVESGRRHEEKLPDSAELQALSGGRRLSLRLTTRCDFDCGHCTLRDQHGRPDRSSKEALFALAEGRKAGCDELVILRGEATLREDLPQLIHSARRMGYRHVQLQTHAFRLSQPAYRGKLLSAGVDSFEVQLLAASEPLHDELTKTRGTFRPTLMALQELVRSGKDVLVTIPLLPKNLRQLGGLIQLCRKVGVRRIQFNFPRPVELVDRVLSDSVPRLDTVSPYVHRAVELALQQGMSVSSEALPLCHLPESLWQSPDATESWDRHRIDDLHLLHDSADSQRRTQRPEPPGCRSCSLRKRCPKTWALYLELFGSAELRPVPGRD